MSSGTRSSSPSCTDRPRATRRGARFIRVLLFEGASTIPVRTRPPPRGGPWFSWYWDGDPMSDKDQQFTRMWNEGNKSKREKFRNLMKSKLAARKIGLSESNARAYFNGNVESIQPERLYESERARGDRVEGPPPPPRP